MVRARLHIICGNCGCNDMFRFQIHLKGRCDNDGTEHPSVAIRCGNCSTIHTLSTTIKEKEKP